MTEKASSNSSSRKGQRGIRVKRMPVGSVDSVCDDCGAGLEGRLAIIKRTTTHGRRRVCLKCAARLKLGYYRPELREMVGRKEAGIYFMDKQEREEWEAIFETPAHEEEKEVAS